MYGSKTVIWKDNNKRLRIRDVQMDKLSSLLGTHIMDKVPNAQIMELCWVRKGMDERIDESFLWWFDHIKKNGE